MISSNSLQSIILEVQQESILKGVVDQHNSALHQQGFSGVRAGSLKPKCVAIKEFKRLIPLIQPTEVQTSLAARFEIFQCFGPGGQTKLALRVLKTKASLTNTA